MHAYPSRINVPLRIFLSTITIAACLQTALAEAAAEVNFIKSESFADMPFSHSGRDDVLKELLQHFEKLAAKLPSGQTLKVDVNDIDLAGRIEPNQIGLSLDTRILRGSADWPSMKFSYSVASQGKVLKSGVANVSDMNYLRRFNRYSANEPLRYEKKMLDDWYSNEVNMAAGQ